jgi:hypothetical protein
MKMFNDRNAACETVLQSALLRIASVQVNKVGDGITSDLTSCDRTSCCGSAKRRTN